MIRIDSEDEETRYMLTEDYLIKLSANLTSQAGREECDVPKSNHSALMLKTSSNKRGNFLSKNELSSTYIRASKAKAGTTIPTDSSLLYVY